MILLINFMCLGIYNDPVLYRLQTLVNDFFPWLQPFHNQPELANCRADSDFTPVDFVPIADNHDTEESLELRDTALGNQDAVFDNVGVGFSPEV